MITEIGKDIFCLNIPFPRSSLKDLNIYIIKADERGLLIDTGFNSRRCLQAIQSALRQLDLRKESIDIFITHFHMDHFGLVSHLASKKNKIYFNRFDTEWFFSWGGFDCHARYLARHGFPDKYIPIVRKSYPEFDGPEVWLKRIDFVKDNDDINMGRFHLKCIHTPGHHRGHMCLYEPDRKLLFCGDHILSDITPIIMCFSDQENPLHDYLNSLEKTRGLDINLVLPGHRGFIYDPAERIDKIRYHHEIRLKEILHILSESPQTAFGISSQIKWNVSGNEWINSAELQKWFALSETIAHIRYLEEAGMVSRSLNNFDIVFHLTN